MEIELDGVQDSDVANVLQAIKDVKHHAAAAPKKANKGMKRKSKQVDELQQAKEALSNDMNRLLVSPYVRNNVKPPALTLDTPAVPALRSLWTLLQGMRIRAEQTPVSKEEEARLEAAVQQAVIAIDPDHESLQEEDEKEKKDTVSMGTVVVLCSKDFTELTQHHRSQPQKQPPGCPTEKEL